MMMIVWQLSFFLVVKVDIDYVVPPPSRGIEDALLSSCFSIVFNDSESHTTLGDASVVAGNPPKK